MTSSLFAWQRAVISSDLDRVLVVTAVRIGLDSAQATGRDVVINTGPVAVNLGCSERTVWRRVQLLVDAGWLAQTSRPTYGGADSRGRRARYALLIPAGQRAPVDPESFDMEAGELAHDPPEVARQSQRRNGTRPPKSCAIDARADVRRRAESSDMTPPAEAHDTPSRVPNPTQSCATATVPDGTLSAFGSYSSSSSELDEMVAVEILASKLRQTTALAGLRTDKLKDHQATQIASLIEQHGDQRLVEQALRGLRRDNPPQTIQAFLPAWSNMPPPGQHLSLVKEPPCTEPGHTGTVRHCIQCSAEQKAGDRR